MPHFRIEVFLEVDVFPEHPQARKDFCRVDL